MCRSRRWCRHWSRRPLRCSGRRHRRQSLPRSLRQHLRHRTKHRVRRQTRLIQCRRSKRSKRRSRMRRKRSRILPFCKSATCSGARGARWRWHFFWRRIWRFRQDSGKTASGWMFPAARFRFTGPKCCVRRACLGCSARQFICRRRRSGKTVRRTAMCCCTS